MKGLLEYLLKVNWKKSTVAQKAYIGSKVVINVMHRHCHLLLKQALSLFDHVRLYPSICVWSFDDYNKIFLTLM